MSQVGVVLQEIKGAVAWVWLNRPHRLNAIDETMLAELRSVFESLDQSETVRAIVLAARGPAFSAGFDVTWMAEQDAEAIADGLDGVRAVYETIESCARPLIAAVHGAAMGGGLLLALVADCRLASDTASFGAPEVKIGLFPSLSLVPRLERAVGVGAARRMVLTGDPVGASEALRIGLVERVVPAERLFAKAQSLADRLAALPPTAVQLSKAAFAAARRPDYAAWEKEQFAVCWQSPEREAAMRAFLKRSPSARPGK